MSAWPRVGDLIEVRGWRITSAEGKGMRMWFDPKRESPMLEATPCRDSEQYESASPPSSIDQREQEGRQGVLPLEGRDSEEVPEGLTKLNYFRILRKFLIRLE